MRRVVLSLLGCLIVGGSPLAAQGTSRVEGLVRAVTGGTPVVNARLGIVGTNLSTVTDAQGRYSFDAVPAGMITIRVIAAGYRDAMVSGLRVPNAQRLLQDFMLEQGTGSSVVQINGFENASITVPTAVLLRFQLLRPSGTKTTDRSIMPIDSVLRDLFQWPGYQLLANAALTADLPRGSNSPVLAQQTLTANGETYELRVQVDSALFKRVRLRVTLSGPTAATTRAGDRGAPVLLSTTLTLGYGNTVVLGSTQPGSGRGGMGGTMILVVRPEARVPYGPGNW